MKNETARSIDKWQQATFNTGQVELMNVVKKLKEEITELDKVLNISASPTRIEIAMEAIDIHIVALAIPRALGLDPQKLLNEKMAINRKRKWTPAVGGIHRHVPDKSIPLVSPFSISPQKRQELRRAGLSVQKYDLPRMHYPNCVSHINPITCNCGELERR